MTKFDVDYNSLDQTMNKKQYKLADVKDRIEKVAFDVVRFKDGDIDQLWQIQSSDEGDYIVSLYTEPEGEVKQASASNWQVVLNKTGTDLNFFYKGEPIVKVAASTLGLPVNELPSVKRYLPVKLAENKKLVQALLKELDATTRANVTRKFPELA